MTKGFIIYALGHSNYYHMAETLAASLHFNSQPACVALICDDKDKVQEPGLFDKIIQIVTSDPLVFNDFTIQMYDHSPYDQTIKLDADMIWLNGRDPMDLFHDLERHDIMHMNRGHGWEKGNSVWCEEEALRDAYGLTDDHKLYKIYGEFVYFRKCPLARKYFNQVRKVYSRPKVRMIDGFSNGTFTDELAYQIASMQVSLEYIDNFTPILNKYLGYAHLEHTFAYQLPKNFYAYSIGGNQTPRFMKEQYNLLARHYYHQLGLTGPYQVKDKKTFLPERKKR